MDCTVCTNPKRHLIDVGLTHAVPLRVLAKRYGASLDAIWRHSKKHLSPQMRAAILVAQKPSAIDLEALKRSEAEGLLAQLVSQRARLQQHSELALDLGNVSDCCKVEGRITANLELVARLLDQLTVHYDVRHTSVLVSPDYLRLRSALIEALRPHPAAMAAVSAALHQIESDAAADIRAKANGSKPLVIEHQPEAPQ